MFPSYYGGHFIDGNGNLVVNIVAGYENTRMFSTVICDILSSSSVSRQQVRFSYAKLQDVMDFLHAYWQANPYCEVCNANVSNALCVINNHIEVGLYGYSEELKTAFRSQVLDSPIVVFVEAWPLACRIGQPVCLSTTEYHESVVEPHSSIIEVRPGDRIWIHLRNGNVEMASAGYGVLQGTRRGFVMAPHDDPRRGNSQISVGQAPGSPIIGFLHYLFAPYRNGVDAGFVEILGNHRIHNHVDGMDIIPGFIPPVVGQALNVRSAYTGIQ